MKKLFLIFILVFVYTLSFCQNKHIGQFVFDITKYGASRSSSDNSAAINAAISAASQINGGAVYIPPGTWKTAQFNLPCSVTLFGDNKTADTLESVNSDTLITSHNTQFSTSGYGNIHDITLYGNNTGVGGLGLYGWYQFSIHNVNVAYFTGKAAYFMACQQGIVTNSWFGHSQYGMYLDSGFVTTPGIFSNQVQFISCHFWYNSTWGYYAKTLQYGANLINSDFISNGTLNTLTTGDTYVGPSTWIGAVFNQCEWEEPIRGTTLLWLSSSAGGIPNTVTHHISDCLMAGAVGCYGIYISHTIYTMNVNIENTIFTNDSMDLEITGTPNIILEHSTYLTTNYTGALASVAEKNLSSAASGIQAFYTGGARAVTITAKNGSGTGASDSVTYASTIMSGAIYVHTGTSPAASDTVAYITVNTPSNNTTFSKQLYMRLYPANSAAAALAGNAQCFVPICQITGSAPFQLYIQTGTVALDPSTLYIWTFDITGQ